MTALDLGVWLGNAPSRAAPGRGCLSRVPRRAAEAALSLAGYRPAPANVWGRGAALDQALRARYCNGQRSGATHPDGRLVARATGLGIFHNDYMSPGGLNATVALSWEHASAYPLSGITIFAPSTPDKGAPHAVLAQWCPDPMRDAPAAMPPVCLGSTNIFFLFSCFMPDLACY